ncbi:MAG: YajQ family cyclic di-GMP-binding protein [Pseudomonadota bacterium]|nr:YajQ family cyclic di-GMP-binding protein [Pseudomonadota bacterium]
MPSFDVVSELDHHEVENAVDQTRREIETRFDFRGVDAKVLLEKNEVTLEAKADFQLKQIIDILRLKISKRGIDLVCLDIKDPEVTIATAKQKIILKEGIDAETAKKIQRLIKDSKIKVQASIQADKLRVTGKSRDDLQETMALLRQQKLEAALQFNNFRD